MRAVGIVVAALVLAGCENPCQTLRSGLEPALQLAIEPEPGELPEGWDWHTATVNKTDVEITYGPKPYIPQSCSDAGVCIRLVYPWAGTQHVADAGPFGMDVRTGHSRPAEAEVLRLTNGLASRLGHWTGESPWQTDWSWAWVVAQGVTLALLLAVALGLAARKWRLLLSWHSLAWAGLVAVALLVRVFVPLAGPFHDNRHGLHFIDIMASGRPPIHHVYSSFMALIGPLVRLFGGWDWAVFALGSLLSALTCPIVGALARRMTGSRIAAWVSGALWAFLPLAVRMGPTESFGNLAAMVLPASALALAVGLDHIANGRRLAWLWFTISSLLMATLAQTQVLATLLPPAAMALGLAATSERLGWKGWLATGLTGFVAAAMLVPHVSSLLDAAGQRDAQALFIGLPSLELAFVDRQLLLLDARTTSLALLPLALVGLAFVSRQSIRAAGFGALGFVWTLVATGLVAGCGSLMADVSLPLGAVTCLLAGVGVTSVAEVVGRFPSRWSHGCVAVHTPQLPRPEPSQPPESRGPTLRAVICAVGLSAVAVMPSWPLVLSAPPDPAEHRFLIEQVLPRLKEAGDVGLVVPRPVTRPQRVAIPPRWWERHAANVALRSEPASTENTAEYLYCGLAAASDKPTCPPGGWVEVVGLDITAPEPGFLCVPLPRQGVHIGLYKADSMPNGLSSRSSGTLSQPRSDTLQPPSREHQDTEPAPGCCD